jgi:hypothetical protein
MMTEDQFMAKLHELTEEFLASDVDQEDKETAIEEAMSYLDEKYDTLTEDQSDQGNSEDEYADEDNEDEEDEE